MIPKAREVRLKPKVRKVLEARCRAPTTAQRDVRRARIVLLAADGHSTRSIAEEVGVQTLAFVRAGVVVQFVLQRRDAFRHRRLEAPAASRSRLAIANIQ